MITSPLSRAVSRAGTAGTEIQARGFGVLVDAMADDAADCACAAAGTMANTVATTERKLLIFIVSLQEEFETETLDTSVDGESRRVNLPLRNGCLVAR